MAAVAGQTGYGSRRLMDVSKLRLPPTVVMVLVAVAIPAIVIGRSVVGVALALALLAVLLLPRRDACWAAAKRVFTSPAAILLALVAVAWLPSLLASPDPWRSFGTEARTFVFIAGGVVVWAAMWIERDRLAVAHRSLLVSTAALCAVALVGLLLSDEFLQFVRGHGWDAYPATRALKESALSAVLLLPLAVFAGYRLGGRWRWLAAIVVVELLALVHLTENRSALAGLLCATLGTALLVVARSRSRRLRWLTVSSVVIVVGFVAVGLAQYQYPQKAYPDVQITPIPYWLIDPPRQGIWLKAWEIGEPYRLFGAGINAIDQLPGASDWNETTSTETIPLHPHNWTLEIIVETGVVGFLTMMAALAYITAMLVTAYLRSGGAARLAANFVWFSYWTIGLFSVSYWSSWLQVSFVAAMAMCLAASGDHAKRPSES